MSEVNLDELRAAYKKLFETDEGKLFMTQVEKIIQLNYVNAESDVEHVRDHFQRAAGNRQVLTHISAVINGVKKGGRQSGE